MFFRLCKNNGMLHPDHRRSFYVLDASWNGCIDMISTMLKMMLAVLSCFKIVIYPIIVIMVLFTLLCLGWIAYYRFKGKKLPKMETVKQKKRSMLLQLLVDVPKRYVDDMYNREPDRFLPKGIHMWCGEQGSGKTMACVEMMTRLQKTYPKAKCITNFGLTTENDELKQWQQLLDYTNGHQGVIVGIDEIQNWFMSGLNKLPEGMLEVATQNRKNCRILCCTAQVFTRVNKGLREQVTMVYNPHTFLGCYTVVIKRKPEFDSEGNVVRMKYRGMYSFVHTKELREAYDTYKVIHTLSKEGFKEQLPIQVIMPENRVVGRGKAK